MRIHKHTVRTVTEIKIKIEYNDNGAKENYTKLKLKANMSIVIK